MIWHLRIMVLFALARFPGGSPAQQLYVVSIPVKAGRLVGLADSYAVLVLADNAKFLLAVNRIVTLR